MIAIQYLEPSPGIQTLTKAEVTARLRAAFDRLPIDIVIIGWDLPPALVAACAHETQRANAQLYLWQPLLTGSNAVQPRTAWRASGLTDEPVSGHHNLPEFTFLCPNRPAVQAAVMEQLRQAVRHGPYQGVFLDRLRYPSPLAQPDRDLACFCADCRRAATFDLLEVQRQVRTLLATPDRLCAALRLLFKQDADLPAELVGLQQFLDFRTQSITRSVAVAAQIARKEKLAVGLDCFSPSLTRAVGQDLNALDAHCDWIKIMTYGHAFGPAGLPYELSNLARWLIECRGCNEAATVNEVAQVAHLPLPPTLSEWRARGLSAEALSHEVRLAQAAGVKTLLAGIELVDLEGVTCLTEAQISADLRALRAAQPAGLALSWDLWRMPLDRLDLVRTIWNGASMLQSK
ncbi:hypothetical protein TFLX_02599 [Thermoflexales bacterium]|nr:hypothetical protein TFLX_02599 [Thermoflexales bacterium]